VFEEWMSVGSLEQKKNHRQAATGRRVDICRKNPTLIIKGKDCPQSTSNQWFLNFLLSTNTLPQLARLRKSTLLKIPAVGRKYTSLIQQWQKQAHFSEEVQWVSEMIQEDALRCLELEEKIKALETKIKQVAKSPRSPRFYYPARKQVWLYTWACPRWTTVREGIKAPSNRSTSTRAKASMMTAIDRHRKYVPESQK
jgi:hypothetical protein